MDKLKFKLNIKRYGSLFIGITLFAIAFNLFILPNNFVYGGVSGISVVTQYLFGINPSTFIFISSVSLLIISYYVLGKEKTVGSIWGSILFPIMVELTSDIINVVNFDTSQMLLSAIFGGVLCGIGAGLTFKAGFTSGGTDIVSQILSKYLKISMGKAMIISDGSVLLIGTFIFGINNLMYALILLYLISVITDRVILGISDSKAFYIFTVNEEKVKDFVLNEMGHGVTIFEAKGGYNNSKQKVLFCVIPTKDYVRLKDGIYSIDENAFFVVMDAYEVYGGE